MNRSQFGLALGAAGLALLAGSTLWAKEKEKGTAADGIAWVKDYNAAVKQAKDQGKWLFVDFYTDG